MILLLLSFAYSYQKGQKSQAEVIEEITDKIDGLDWKTFAKSDEFYSFKVSCDIKLGVNY